MNCLSLDALKDDEEILVTIDGADEVAGDQLNCIKVIYIWF